jgi:hypothetical protein
MKQMMLEPNYLFVQGELQAMLNTRSSEAEWKVDAIQSTQLLRTSVEEIVDHLVNQIYVEPLKIYKDKMVHDREEIKIDIQGSPRGIILREGPCLIPGIKLTISLPFSGDARLWQLRPNLWSSVLPHGIVKNGSDGIGNLDMIFEQTISEPLEQFERELDQNLGLIHKHLASQKEIIDQFNKNLPNIIRALIEARRKRLLIQDNLDNILKIPLKHNPNAPNIQSIQIQKRIVKPLPLSPITSNKPEWGIEERDYEDILTIIRHEGRTFEATPKTFAVHGEEGLRDIILAHLNGHYKGDASAETFRRSGKTDIRIEAKTRYAFVAECKIWKGPKTISDCIDQLLSYLTWRDCKTAIILFNKDISGFIDILQKTKTAIESHPCFKNTVFKSDQGEWRCIFRSTEDEARLLQIHIFHFNLYVIPKSKNKECLGESR